MKRSVSQESINSGRRTPDGVTQRPAFLRSLSIEPDSPGLNVYDDDPAGKSPRDRPGLIWGRRPSPKGMPPSPHGPHPRPWPYVLITAQPRELFRIASYNTGQVFVAGQTKLAKEKIKRDKDGYVLDAESKRVPVVLQYSSFDFLKDKAKAIVEAHATEAIRRWNV